MANFKKSKYKINGNIAPDDFLEILTSKVKALPDSVFAVNPNVDIFSVMKPVFKQYTSIPHRRACLTNGLTCLASLESSFNWLAGKDPGANNNSPQTMESGIFQCSANSMVFGKDLQSLFMQHTGILYSQSNAACKTFISQMKTDHEFAVEYMIKLCRIRVDTHGPLKRGEINKWLSKDAVAELEAFYNDSSVEEPETIGSIKKPRSYEEVYKIFGNPKESSWSNKNLGFCPVNIPCFPMVSAHNARGFYCHKLLVPSFKKVFDEIVEKGLSKSIYSFDGCYNLRNISGSSNLSLHSWAIAIDLNYDGNELGDTTPAMNMKIVEIFKKNGFFWGGDYHGRKDPMHFEYYDRS